MMAVTFVRLDIFNFLLAVLVARGERSAVSLQANHLATDGASGAAASRPGGCWRRGCLL